jgi:glutamyl-tRNA reductase
MNLPGGSPSAETRYISDGEKLPVIVVAGINHLSAPVGLRECLAFDPEESQAALQFLKKTPEIKEILILSTCNRVEMIMTTHDPERAVERVEAYIARARSVDLDRLRQAMYTYTGPKAVAHLYRVAASLDSMVLGEPQILGQVKAAYKTGVEAGTTGVIVNRLLHKAFSVAKRIRSETGIGDRAVSISYAAVELARKIFGRLDDKTVLLVGAGEMAELAVEHLNRSRFPGELYVANRTFAVGVDLARRFSGKAIAFEEIGQILKSADIIISSTGAPGYVLTKDHVRPVMRKRKNRPLFSLISQCPGTWIRPSTVLKMLMFTTSTICRE